MRVQLVAAASILAVVAAPCTSADEGNLAIRCPTTNGAVAVPDGQVTIDGAVMHVSAEVRAPVSVDHGATFAIDLQVPSEGSASPTVQCIRVKKQDENVQWDAVPWRMSEVRGGVTTRIRAEGGEGPHWLRDQPIAVLVWIKTQTSGRHVLDLGVQAVRGADGS